MRFPGLGAVAAFVLSGCASTEAGRWIPPEPRVLALARRAEALLAEERVGEALEAAREAVALDPDGADARRMLQTTRRAAGEDWEVREEARARVDSRPGDPVALYLLARTEHDARRARHLLEDALDREPGLLWARLGLAQILEGEGRHRAALAQLALAERAAPGHPWIPYLVAGVEVARNRPERAVAALRETTRRDPSWYRGWEALGKVLLRDPGGEEEGRAALGRAFALVPRSRFLADAWRETLDDGGFSEEETRESLRSPDPVASFESLHERNRDRRLAVAEAVDRAEAEGPLTPAARHLRGAALLRAGEAAAAIPDLHAALDGGQNRTAALDDLRRALFKEGRYLEALAAEAAVTPSGVLRDPLSETDALRWEIERAAAALVLDPGDPAALGRLSGLCRRAGWHHEAWVLAARRWVASHGDPAAVEAHDEARRTLAFLDAFRAAWKGTYFGYASGEDGGSVDDALAVLRDLSVRHLGVDLTRGIARTDFGMLGEMADSVRATGPCGEWFREHGLALVVGRVAGQPVEARLLRVVALRTARTERILGRPFPVTTVVGEGLLVPSLRESSGAVLGGATVGDLVFVDLEGVARWSAEASRAARGESPGVDPGLVGPVPATGEEERFSLRHPGRLGERIAARVPRWRDPRAALEDFFDAARWHEFAHAADSARYLPVLSHPLEGLRLFLRGGMSGEGVAAVLEGDAEIAALAAAREPRAALVTMTSFLPSREGSFPHARGYADALEDLLRVLEERGAVRPGVNLLRELDAVPPGVLRAAAREVCRRRGLVGE